MDKQRTANSEQQTREQIASAPFFSIIVPVYNVAPYLRECLDSVLAQTYPNWECLCVDDGSTDESGAILDEYAQKDSRFRIFHKSNSGVSAARNLALEHAKGEWIWFVDGDDAIRRSALERLFSYTNESGQIDFVSFNAIVAGQLKQVAWLQNDLAQHESVTRLNSKSLIARNRAGWATIVRKPQTRFMPYVHGEDSLFQLTELWKHPTGIITNELLYFYRMREGSAIRSAISLRKTHDFLMVERDILRMFSQDKTQWQFDECREYLCKSRDAVWYTYDCMLGRLGCKDLKKIIPLWCQVQKMQFSLLSETFKRRAVCWVIEKTNSPLLCKILVFGWINTKRQLRRLLCSVGLLDFVKRIRKTLSIVG